VSAAIEVSGVHKTFRIPHERHTTLTERVLNAFRPSTYERFEALSGVDLVVEDGSFTGVIGRNGSGKSTLLKVIAGLLLPDAGAVHVRGSLCELLELGLGFSPELTVRENVTLYAAILGYPWRQTRARVEQAITYADLHRFRDTKLKNLSTGMRMRLGFAAALQADSDVLLLDEILAVGDAEFQRKCIDTFHELKRRRKTIVLISHDMSQIRQFCDRVVFFDAGRVLMSGEPEVMIARYEELVGSLAPGATASAGDARGLRGMD
jgi:lipopolysaccharide transport system ATP-binding protein